MYQHGRKSKRRNGSKTFLHGSLVLGLALVIGAYVLHKDLSTSTGEKTTVPIVTEVKENQGEVIKIEEPLFRFELPTDWKQSARQQTNSVNYYEWRSTKAGANDRLLQLHINIIPSSYKVVRMQPLTPNGNKVILGNISGNCINFATNAGVRANGNAPVEAKWEKVTFMCDPISANQTVGTGTPEGSIGTQIGRSKFYFYYEDHNIRPDDKILQDALRSFQAR